MNWRIARCLTNLVVSVLVFVALSLGSSSRGSAQQFVWPSDATEWLMRAGKAGAGLLGQRGRLIGVRVSYSIAYFDFVSPTNGRFTVAVTHASESKGAARVTVVGPFAVAREKGRPPRWFLQAFAKTLARKASGLGWSKVLPRLAVPIHKLNGPAYTLTDEEARESYRKALESYRRGDHKQCLAIAAKLGREARRSAQRARAAMSLHRICGRPADGDKLARHMHIEDNPDLMVEQIATLLVAGAYTDAARVADGLASDFPWRARTRSCALAEAIHSLALDGLLSQAKATIDRIAWESDRASRKCVALVKIGVFSALGDDDEVDRTGTTALKVLGQDLDIRFLWGTHYYSKGAVIPALKKAVQIWRPIADAMPDYPTFLGQYGTAWLVAGLLDDIHVVRHLAEGAKGEGKGRPAKAFLAGLGYFYKMMYRDALPLLAQAAKAVPTEPRAKMYTAMAYFFTGHRDVAERMLEELESFAHHEPDINYCLSLVYRGPDLPRAIEEMEKFLKTFKGEGRLAFGSQKVQKAISDLEAMKRGEVPSVFLPLPDFEPACKPGIEDCSLDRLLKTQKSQEIRKNEGGGLSNPEVH